MSVLQRRPVVSAAVLAALPALGFAMLTTAGAAATGPSAGPTCDPTETTSATPSDSITPSILATPSVVTSPQPALTTDASPAVSASPSCSPSGASPPTASEPSESAATSPSASPSTDARQIEGAATEPRPAAIRGVLTANESRMEGFGFAGVVTQQTEAGDVRALRFIADTNTLTDMRLTVTDAGVTQTTRGSGDPTVMSGHVVMDVTVFTATFLGEPVEFTPDNPPPAALIQPDMTFTDVEAHLVSVTCDEMTIDGMTQSLSGG
ncbi:MAG TPA: hypothetical protein VGS60_07745 [Actinomycetes bacterium]|nr:hypothetical protein [Actinomycetes bacterium]